MLPGPSILASFSLASLLKDAKFSPAEWNASIRRPRLPPDNVTPARRSPFAGLPGDRNGSGFHGDDAVVDVGEHLFAGAEIAEAIWTGHRKTGLPDGLLQLRGEPLAFIVLQFAEAGGHDGCRARAGCGSIPD